MLRMHSVTCIGKVQCTTKAHMTQAHDLWTPSTYCAPSWLPYPYCANPSIQTIHQMIQRQEPSLLFRTVLSTLTGIYSEKLHPIHLHSSLLENVLNTTSFKRSKEVPSTEVPIIISLFNILASLALMLLPQQKASNNIAQATVVLCISSF